MGKSCLNIIHRFETSKVTFTMNYENITNNNIKNGSLQMFSNPNVLENTTSFKLHPSFEFKCLSVLSHDDCITI